MNRSNLNPRALAALGFLVATQSIAGDPVEIAFQPEEDGGITKTFRTKNTVDLGEFSLVVDGEDVGPLLGAFEVSTTNSMSIVLTDSYLEVTDGHLASFTRTFDEVAAEAEMSMGTQFGDHEQVMGSESEFEGATIGFTWNAEEEEYETEIVDGEVDVDSLDGLVAETDLLFLLPEADVSEGGEWTVELVEFQKLIAPGGDLRLLPENMPDMDGFGAIQERLGGRVWDAWEEAFDGDAACTYQGMEEVDDLNLAVIGIELEFETNIDLVSIVEEMLEIVMEEVELPVEIEIEFDILDLSIAVESRGELRWNLGAGELYSLEMSTDGEFEFEISLAVDAGDQTPTIEGDFGMSLTQENTVSVDS